MFVLQFECDFYSPVHWLSCFFPTPISTALFFLKYFVKTCTEVSAKAKINHRNNSTKAIFWHQTSFTPSLKLYLPKHPSLSHFPVPPPPIHFRSQKNTPSVMCRSYLHIYLTNQPQIKYRRT